MFDVLRTFDEAYGWNNARMNLLGVNDMKGIIPEGTSTLHFVMWKFILIQLTMFSLKGIPIDPYKIIECGLKRLNKRLKSVRHEITRTKNKVKARYRIESPSEKKDKEPVMPELNKFARWTEGLASIENNELVLKQELTDLFKSYDVT